ncbi:hypothetical protein JOB18_008904 [Solea senegalensis]|uniref:Uncharacterized protein n=1 Tax=Solea senegalensis TaxID=28829 RepID=A0AAV6S823_SOLSE|nr:hypothetical protein JOB18_008904 [Solea senegalensis]
MHIRLKVCKFDLHKQDRKTTKQLNVDHLEVIRVASIKIQVRCFAGIGAVRHETIIGSVFQNDMKMFVDRYADLVLKLLGTLHQCFPPFCQWVVDKQIIFASKWDERDMFRGHQTSSLSPPFLDKDT